MLATRVTVAARRGSHGTTDGILTTHTGKPPRPAARRPTLRRFDAGELTDASDFADEVADAVERSVRRQVEFGIDIVNDGEIGKVNDATYATRRLT